MHVYEGLLHTKKNTIIIITATITYSALQKTQHISHFTTKLYYRYSGIIIMFARTSVRLRDSRLDMLPVSAFSLNDSKIRWLNRAIPRAHFFADARRSVHEEVYARKCAGGSEIMRSWMVWCYMEMFILVLVFT